MAAQREARAADQQAAPNQAAPDQAAPNQAAPGRAQPTRAVRVFAGIVAVASVLGSGYFIVRGLVDPGALVPGGDAEASRTFAAYMSARGIVLGAAMIWLLAVRSWRPLGLVLALNGAVQLVDAVIGAAHHEVPNTVGPLVFAIALLAAARTLGGLRLAPGRHTAATA